MLKEIFRNGHLRETENASEAKLLEMIEPERLPKHIAVIMDGNGRWARRRGLPRVAGYRHGVESLREITRACAEIGVQILTIFAFSTENWNRPQEEVNYLLNLLDEVLDRELPELHANGVRVENFGTALRFVRRIGPKDRDGRSPDGLQSKAPPQRGLQLRRQG